MRRPGRVLAGAVGVGLSAPLFLYLALRLGLLTPLFNLALRYHWPNNAPIQVRIGALRSDVSSFLEADDVVVLTQAKGAKLPLITLASLRLEYRGWSAWRGRLSWDEALSLARIKGLKLFLLRNAQGAWNLSALKGLKGQAPSTAKGAAAPLALVPASRVELEDSQVILNDEARGFHTSIDRLQGSLDTRALPLLAFTLSGRTEGKDRDDLSVAGEMDQRDDSLFSRLDLDNVPLARYLNYFLPGKGLRFESGSASLSVRLRRPANGEIDASGRAEIADGSLRIPGIAEPLTGLEGAVAFDPGALHFRELRAHFLDSDWVATGAINDLTAPSFDVEMHNPAFPLQALSDQVRGMGHLGMSGTAQVDAELSGPVKGLVVHAAIQAPAMSLLGAELTAVSASARLKGARLQVEGLQARLWGGALHGTAVMGLAQGGKIEASLDLAGASLSEARLHGVRPLPLSGMAQASLQASGLLHSPQLGLTLTVLQSSLGDLDLGRIDVNADYGPQGLKSQFHGAGERLSGSINFGRGAKAKFEGSKIALHDLDLARLAHGLATAGTSLVLPAAGVKAGAWIQGRLAGTIRADLSFEGPVSSPSTWINVGLQSGKLFVTHGPLRLQDPEAGVPLSLRGSLGFQKGDLWLGRDGQPFHIGLNRKGKNMSLLALGRYPLKNSGKPGHMELALDGDLRVMDVMEGFKQSQGQLKADVTFSGTFDAPQADGELSVADFSTVPKHYLAPIKDGEAKVQFGGQRVELSLLRFKSGGELTASGNVDLSAGLKGLHGSVVMQTDDEGLHIANWDAMGSGNLSLSPLVLSVEGEGQPIRLDGQARLSNAVVVYGGPGKPTADAAGAAPKERRAWDVNLKVGLGPNVWYEKRATGGVEIFDPSRWLSGTLESVQETFQRPDVFFRLRPTDQDILIRHDASGLQMVGTLTIDRGRLTLMENDFEIKPERKPAVIRFNGGNAEVSAEAVGSLRYTRDNAQGRPQQVRVDVVIKVDPLPPEELERSALANSFLNYSLSFGVDTPIPNVKDADQQTAILNLVVLGDPLVDLQDQGPGSTGESSFSKLTDAQLNRLISGEAKRQLAKWSKRGFRFLGTQLVDVLRVVPRFAYQSVGSGGATTPGQASQQAQESQLVFSDLTVEIGKSLSEKLYASMLWVRFGENGIEAATSGALTANQEVRDSGARIGLEYQISPNRTLEAFYNYSLDDNLQPKPFDPNDLSQAHSGIIRLRNTIPTDNYSPELARERRWDGEHED